MSEVASRDLRNHTAEVLRRVQAGEEITITVRGKPVAHVVPLDSRPRHLSREEFMERRRNLPHDPTFVDDMEWISGGTTDDLGPIR